MLFIIYLITTLAAPIVLLPVEQIIAVPFIYLLEEVFKAGLVQHNARQHTGGLSKLNTGKIMILGFAFTISETSLYLMNFFLLNDFSQLWTRLWQTGLMHTTTFLILFYSSKKGRLGLTAGFILACAVHVGFNEWVVQ